MKKTFVLAIVDGWGVSDELANNAISMAKTPTYDRLLSEYPVTTLQASGSEVGLPNGQMGNSEVGHLTIGAGRVVPQTLVRMDKMLLNSSEPFIDSQFLKSLVRKAQHMGSAVHLMGLLSPGGVHSHQAHIEVIYDYLKDHGIDVYMHAFLDGRDTGPKSAVEWVGEFCSGEKRAITTMSGRYYAMDRDQNWDRIEKSYAVMANALGETFEHPIKYIQNVYDQGGGDEFILPAYFKGYNGISDGDMLICMNFRSDRVQQILEAFLNPEFKVFSRRPIFFSKALGMVSYSEKLDEVMDKLLSPNSLKNTLGEWISKQGLSQLRLAETEKYAHVTFFLNGGREENFLNEDRELISSKKVKTYDQCPEMSAKDLTQSVIEGIGKYDLIVVNYANADMVGHTGVMDAAIQAVECLDQEFLLLEKAILDNDACMIITSDHGNIESMWNSKTNHQNTAHTLNSVPMIIVQNKGRAKFRLNCGKLADVAPTLLNLMEVQLPEEMEGKCLIV